MKAIPTDHRILGTIHARWRTGVVALLLGLYALLAWHYKPLSPFEWDEFLFLRSLDHYDVADHAPHPPGYPLFVALGKLLAMIAATPFQALQILSIVSALASVVLTGFLAKRLGAPPPAAIAAAFILACIPAFLLHSNNAFSDMTGLAFGLVALLALLRAMEDPARLPIAAVFCAMALGVRPQWIVLLAVPAGFAISAALCRRQGGRLIQAVFIGAAVSAAIWLPAILLTGWRRYWGAFSRQANWLATMDSHETILRTGAGKVLGRWVALPFGSVTAALCFWALLGAGSWMWWNHRKRTGGRVLLLTALVGSAAFMLAMDSTVAARYALPLLPLWAILAGGTLFPQSRRFPTVASTALLLILGLSMMLWFRPVALLQYREASPVTAAMEWIARNYGPRDAVVFCDSAIRPHARQFLEARGFQVVSMDARSVDPKVMDRSRTVLICAQTAQPGGRVRFEAHWNLRPLAALSRYRYLSCVVQETPSCASPDFSAEWSYRKGRWTVNGLGTVSLPPWASPTLVHLQPLNAQAEVRRSGRPLFTLFRGQSARLPLCSGPAGALEIGSGNAMPVAFESLQGELPRPPGPEPATVIPAAAGIHGAFGAIWRTEIEIINPNGEPAECSIEFLENGAVNATPLTATFPLPGPGRLAFDDAIVELFGKSGAGALRFRCSSPAVSIQTSMRRILGDRSAAVGIPKMDPGEAIRFGERGEIAGLQNSPSLAGGARCNIGLVGTVPTLQSVEVALYDPSNRWLGTKTIILNPYAFVQWNGIFGEVKDGPVLGGRAVFRPLTPGGGLIAYASMIDNEGPGWRFLIAKRAPAAGSDRPKAVPPRAGSPPSGPDAAGWTRSAASAISAPPR